MGMDIVINSTLSDFWHMAFCTSAWSIFRIISVFCMEGNHISDLGFVVSDQVDDETPFVIDASGNVGIGKGVFTALTSGTYNTGIGHAVITA